LVESFIIRLYTKYVADFMFGALNLDNCRIKDIRVHYPRHKIWKPEEIQTLLKLINPQEEGFLFFSAFVHFQNSRHSNPTIRGESNPISNQTTREKSNPISKPKRKIEAPTRTSTKHIHFTDQLPKRQTNIPSTHMDLAGGSKGTTLHNCCDPQLSWDPSFFLLGVWKGI
jgi:hypothetical protein